MIIAKNTNGGNLDLYINQGKTIQIPTGGQVDLLDECTREELAIADDIIYHLTNNSLIINNGSEDLSLPKALDLIRNYKQVLATDSSSKLQLSGIERDDGKIEVASSTRQVGTIVGFTSSFDDMSGQVVGGGNRIHIDLLIHSPLQEPAIDLGSGQVAIKINESCDCGNVTKMRISGTTNYDGDYDCTIENEQLILNTSFVAETFTGNELLIPMESSVEGIFIDDFWLKDGLIKNQNAPDGARVTMQIIAPTGYPYFKSSVNDRPCAADNPDAVMVFNTGSPKVIMQPVLNVELTSDNPYGEELDSEALAMLPSGYIVRLVATNSNEEPDSFKVWGRLEGCRKHQI